MEGNNEVPLRTAEAVMMMMMMMTYRMMANGWTEMMVRVWAQASLRRSLLDL